MSFAAGLHEGRFVAALEITPPQQPRPHVLLRRAGLLGGAAEAINVIHRRDRQSSLHASVALQQAGLQPVWHLANRGRGRNEVMTELATAATAGIRYVLCMRGDHGAADVAGTPTIREVIALARTALPDALIGATLNQYAAEPAAALRNLLPKLAAGASYVQTQPVFDLAALRPAIERLKDASPETRIVAMTMPILTLQAAARIEQRLTVSLPDAWRARLQPAASAVAWQPFEATMAALVQAPWVDGVAIMTFELDAPAELGQCIVMALRAAGIRSIESGQS